MVVATGRVPQTSRSNLRGLEQLQYQLTSKELQYAQRTLAKNTGQRGLTPEGNTSEPLAEPALSHKPAENSGVQARDEIISPWQPSFSSDDRASLQEVWKLLDEDSPGVTPRGARVDEVSARVARDSSSTAGSFTVKGKLTRAPGETREH